MLGQNKAIFASNQLQTYVCCMSLTDQEPPWCSVNVLTVNLYV
jgi:hypothetical protein